MKLYQGECKSYSIDELTEKAKEHAYDKWIPTSDYPYGNDSQATLDEFCRLFDVNMKNWSYDSCNYNYSFSIINGTLDDDENGLMGIRLATYLWNNYAKYITQGKYYNKSKYINGKYKLKSRYGKVITTMTGCPLIGYCMDCDILEPIIECLTYKTLFNSYEDLIEQCLENFFVACKKDAEWCESMEYFVEEAQNNDYEYDKEGNAFRLPYGFKEAV